MEPYLPISHYGAVGNLRSVALIGRNGSIDWCCFPVMDRPSVFAALLDHNRGGRFAVSAPELEAAGQRYLEDTNILETLFKGPSGRATLTDFMPIGGSIHGRGQSEADPEIQRIIHCSEGEIVIEVEWSPRFDYARRPTQIGIFQGGWMASGGPDSLVLGGLPEGRLEQDKSGPVLRGRFRMQAGQRRVLAASWGMSSVAADLSVTMSKLDQTASLWRRWVHQEGASRLDEWAGDLHPTLIRSGLILKLLTNNDTGAIAAAPSTSLPERIGGLRNWDYRFAWIRDSFQTIQALLALEHAREALDLFHWMEKAVRSSCIDGSNPQVMYGLRGETDPAEIELNHLEGYRNSRPVRIGNGAAKQLQIEVYGNLIHTAYELAGRGEILDPNVRALLAHIADRACGVWREPDHGIWEVRSEPRHFTYSKVMVWVALDRAVQLAEKYGLEGNAALWRETGEAVRQAVLENGIDRSSGCFVRSFGAKDLDAANLLIPLVELLPPEDPRVQATIDRTMAELMENCLVYRYRSEDGLPEGEGAFGLCTCWLIDALALSGRLKEAWDIFDRLRRRAGHLGLFPEQFDPRSGEFLGNYPQAFTHIGLINSSLYLSYAEGRRIPGLTLIGTPEHREEF